MSDSTPTTNSHRRWRQLCSSGRGIFVVVFFVGVLLVARHDNALSSDEWRLVSLRKANVATMGQPEGSALAFDGSETRVTAPHVPFDEYDAFTIEAWVRGWKGVVLAQGIAGDPENSVWLAVGTRNDSPYQTCGWEAEEGTNHQVAIGNAADRVEWNHLALVYDGENQNVFVNGELVRTRQVPPPSPLDRDRSLQIGVHDHEDPKHGTGLLGPVRISKCVRYDESFEPNWDFAEDEDTVVHYALPEGMGRRLHDFSGNGNDATVSGPRWLDARDVFSIDFSRTQVTDEELEQLQTLEMLEILSLERTTITDDGLEHLMELKNLRYLDIRGTAVTEFGLEQLRRALPELEIVGGSN